MRARGGPELAENLVEDLNKDLVIVYAEDSPRNIRFLTASNLTELGIEKEQLRALAVANLRRLVPTPEVTRGPLVSMIVAGGDYEASLLLFDELWSGGPVSVDGEIVVAIPARNILLFAGSRNKAGIARLRQLASKYAREAPYRLTGRLFVFRGGRFVPFDK
jgi:uncharacterized protein YtpQ (UPF0354 family)